MTLALGANTTGATLSGTTTVTVSGGTANFNNLSIGTLGSYHVAGRFDNGGR